MWETYPKQTYRNRCRILSANGILNLSVPVIRTHGNHTLIKDIRIDNSTPWQRTHWRGIFSAYNSAPFFIYYCDQIEKAFLRKFSHLIDLNIFIIENLNSLIGFNKEFKDTSQFEKEPFGKINLIHQFNPKKPSDENLHYPPYFQVFQNKFGFTSNLSIIDLIFCEGPGSLDYLKLINTDSGY